MTARGAGAGAVFLVVATLVACGAPPVGRAGVGVDGEGRLVGYLEVCADHIDGVTIADSQGVTVGRWRSDAPVTHSASWSLSDPQDGWTVVEPLGELEPGVTYRVSGWTQDDTHAASGVDFTTEDLASASPGEVLFVDDGVVGVGKPDVFRTYSCTT